MNITEYAIFKKMAGGSGGGGGEGESVAQIFATNDSTVDFVDTSITTVGYMGMGNRRFKTISLPSLTSVDQYGFKGCTSTELHLPSVTEIGAYAFDSCSKLVSISFPKVVEQPGGYIFQSCRALETADFPVLAQTTASMFASCTKLKTVNLPVATLIWSYTFNGCSSIQTLDFPAVTEIQRQAFQNCYTLKALVIRSATLCKLEDTNAFNGCYHLHGTVNSTYNPDGLKDGYIYVPRALIDQYKTATNWVTYATQFRALEDYTVDGTITGELDWNKVNKVVINFTIDGTSYQADEGMTWTEWCGSSYNTAGYVASSSDQSVIAPSGNSLLDASSHVVDKSAAIINSHAYKTYNHGGGGAN